MTDVGAKFPRRAGRAGPRRTTRDSYVIADFPETLKITVAATENLLGIFEVPGGGAPAGSHWADLPKTTVRAEPGQTSREVLDRAAVQLGIQPTAQVRQMDAQFRPSGATHHGSSRRSTVSPSPPSVAPTMTSPRRIAAAFVATAG